MPPDNTDATQKETAPGAQDAQKAEERKQSDSHRSPDVGLQAAYWAVQEARYALRYAANRVVGGDPPEALGALNRASRAIGAAQDSLQGLMP